MEDYKVGIILVNYNGAKYNEECIRSIKESTYNNYEIIVVDNCSTDKSVEQLQKQFNKEIKIIQSKENLGFSGGNNLGIKYALTSKCDYIMLLNNDTTIHAEMIKIMIETAVLNNFKVIAPKIFYYDNPKMIWSTGTTIHWKKGIPKQNGINVIDNGEFQERIEVESATGCCILIHKDVVENIGMLSEEYFLYYEDTDYSATIQSKKIKIIYEPKAIMYHKVSASTGGEESPNYIYYNTRNRLIFNKKFNYENRLTYIPYFYITRLFKICIWLLKGRIDLIKATIQGIKDFKMGIEGKRLDDKKNYR